MLEVQGTQYKISDDGREVLYYNTSAKAWFHSQMSPVGRTFVNLRKSANGLDIQFKCSDGVWYERKFGGVGIVPVPTPKKKSESESRPKEKSEKKGPSFLSRAAGAALDAELSRQERKAAEMAAEREAEQAERQRQREERRRQEQEYRESREYIVESILGPCECEDYNKWIERLIMNIGSTKYEVRVDEVHPYLSEAAGYDSDDEDVMQWLDSCNFDVTFYSSAEKATHRAETSSNRKSRTDCIKEFCILFPDPESEYSERVQGFITEMYENEHFSVDELVPYLKKCVEPKDPERFDEWISEFKSHKQDKTIEGWALDFSSVFPDPEIARNAAREAQSEALLAQFERLDSNENQKKKGVAIALGLFLGIFGAHQFYLGNKKKGILYLGLTCLSPWMLSLPLLAVGGMTIYDIIQIAIKPQENSENPITSLEKASRMEAKKLKRELYKDLTTNLFKK